MKRYDPTVTNLEPLPPPISSSMKSAGPGVKKQPLPPTAAGAEVGATPLTPPAVAASKRPILYYSNYCKNSRLVIQLLLKNKLREMFACVCVDTRPELVPPFVTMVPTIFIATDRKLLRDANLSAYLGQLIEAKKTQVAAVEPVEGNSGMAEAFSWVDHEKQEQEGNLFSSRFVPVNYTQHFDSIEEKMDNSKEDTEAQMSKAFEMMRNQRDADLMAASKAARANAGVR